MRFWYVTRAYNAHHVNQQLSIGVSAHVVLCVLYDKRYDWMLTHNAVYFETFLHANGFYIYTSGVIASLVGLQEMNCRYKWGWKRTVYVIRI